jgi:ABC-type nitrate/sulfonate/bicarbonate transport system substrate-binding protein
MVSRLVAGTFSPSVLLDVARTTGRLADAGLEVTEVPVASSPGQFRSLTDGEIDIAFTSPDNVLAYRFSATNPLGTALDVGMVTGIDRGLGLALYGRPGFTAEQLAGARVGVDVPVSGFALAMYALTESLGVPRGGYELLTLGSTPRRLEALLAGDCDATMLNAGNELLAEEAGCVRLASVAEVCGPYLGTVTAVSGQSRLAEARALGEALTVTIGDIRSGAASDAALDAAATRLHVAPEVARRYVDRLQDPAEGLLPDGQVDPAGLATVAALRRRFLPEAGDSATPR